MIYIRLSIFVLPMSLFVDGKPQYDSSTDPFLASFDSQASAEQASRSSADAPFLLTMSVCSSLTQSCAPTIRSCASSMCQYCDAPFIAICCTNPSVSPAPTGCLSSNFALYSSELNAATDITPQAALPTIDPNDDNDSNAVSCAMQAGLSSSCAEETSGFTDITDFSSQASCLCYSSNTFNPEGFDPYASECAAYLSASPNAVFTSLNSNRLANPTSPCAGLGDFINRENGLPTETGGSPSVAVLQPKSSSTSSKSSGSHSTLSSASSLGRSGGRSSTNMFAGGDDFHIKVCGP